MGIRILREYLQWCAGGDIPQLNSAFTRARHRAPIRVEGHAVENYPFAGVSVLSQ